MMFDFWTVFFATVVVFLYIWWKKTTRDAALPPGPPTLPFLGNLLNVMTENLLETFQEYRQKYGDVFSLVTGSETMVVVCGYETLKTVFINHGDVTSERPDVFITREIYGLNGIANTNGALWKEHRTFTLNALREFGFGKRSLESRIIEEVEVFVQEIQLKKGEAFNIHNLVTVSVSNIMCSITFGKRYDHSEEQFLSLLDKFEQYNSNGNLLFVATILPFVKYIPGDPCRINTVLKGIQAVKNHLKQLVEEHKQQFDENNLQDYIDVFLKKMEIEKDNPSTTFDDDQLLGVLFELFEGGTETTSTTLRWFCLFMIRHPDAQEKMRKEIIDVIGTSRFPSMEDKKNMPYCEAVMHETLRVGAIGPLSFPHGLTTDLSYNGSTIPKDAILIPNLYSVFFDEKIFPEPHDFKPERFFGRRGKSYEHRKSLGIFSWSESVSWRSFGSNGTLPVHDVIDSKIQVGAG